jgi:hypothetical protein
MIPVPASCRMLGVEPTLSYESDKMNFQVRSRGFQITKELSI